MPGPAAHDLVDVGREALAHASDLFHEQIDRAVAAANRSEVVAGLQAMYALIADMDALCAFGGGWVCPMRCGARTRVASDVPACVQRWCWACHWPS